MFDYDGTIYVITNAVSVTDEQWHYYANGLQTIDSTIIQRDILHTRSIMHIVT